MARRNNAFTIVELLVVVSLIVILIAILMPSLEKAMSAAQSAKCASNLRAMSLAMKMYSNDHMGQKVTWTGGYRNYWTFKLATYFGASQGVQGNYQGTNTDAGYDGDVQLILCPSSVPNPPPNRDAYSDGFYNFHKAKNWFLWGATSSYTVNTWATDSNYYNSSDLRAFSRYDQVPSGVVVFSDSAWADVMAERGQFPSYNRINIKRHNDMGINITSADASAAFIDQPDIPDTRWNNE